MKKGFLLLSFMMFSCQAFVATHHPEAFLKSIADDPNAGQAIVSHFCITCHGLKPDIAVGAPRIGVDDDWRLRLKPGWKRLFERTSTGVGIMPPRGGCFECTDAQLEAAMHYLIYKNEPSLKK